MRGNQLHFSKKTQYFFFNMTFTSKNDNNRRNTHDIKKEFSNIHSAVVTKKREKKKASITCCRAVNRVASIKGLCSNNDGLEQAWYWNFRQDSKENIKGNFLSKTQWFKVLWGAKNLVQSWKYKCILIGENKIRFGRDLKPFEIRNHCFKLISICDKEPLINMVFLHVIRTNPHLK